MPTGRCRGLRPGGGIVATDVCVPISRLADCVVETEEDLIRLGLLSPIVGHVGDGNFHCSLLADTDNADEMARAEEFGASPGGTGAGHGRHLHRRARRWPGQAEIPARLNSAPRRSTPCAH